MTLKEVFDQGACKVGNIIILEGGQHFLIGDATPFHGPSQNDAGRGWDGWLEKTVLYVLDLLEPKACAILDAFKDRCSLEGEQVKKESQDVSASPTPE